MDFMKRNLKDNVGFTLIELLIVVIILAILIAIAVPSYLAMKDRAREAGTESEMRNIVTAIEIYHADKNVYPPTSSGKAFAAHLEGYMDHPPLSDLWSTDYEYMNLETDGYTLTSAGKSKNMDNLADNIVFTNGQIINEGSYPRRH